MSAKGSDVNKPRITASRCDCELKLCNASIGASNFMYLMKFRLNDNARLIMVLGEEKIPRSVRTTVIKRRGETHNTVANSVIPISWESAGRKIQATRELNLHNACTHTHTHSHRRTYVRFNRKNARSAEKWMLINVGRPEIKGWRNTGGGSGNERPVLPPLPFVPLLGFTFILKVLHVKSTPRRVAGLFPW